MERDERCSLGKELREGMAGSLTWPVPALQTSCHSKAWIGPRATAINRAEQVLFPAKRPGKLPQIIKVRSAIDLSTEVAHCGSPWLTGMSLGRESTWP